MPKRSKKGKYRPRGPKSKVKFDILPPRGDAEVSVVGFAALFIGALIGALLLVQVSALAVLAWPLTVGAVVIFLVGMAIKAVGGPR